MLLEVFEPVLYRCCHKVSIIGSVWITKDNNTLTQLYTNTRWDFLPLLPQWCLLPGLNGFWIEVIKFLSTENCTNRPRSAIAQANGLRQKPDNEEKETPASSSSSLHTIQICTSGKKQELEFECKCKDTDNKNSYQVIHHQCALQRQAVNDTTVNRCFWSFFAVIQYYSLVFLQYTKVSNTLCRTYYKRRDQWTTFNGTWGIEWPKWIENEWSWEDEKNSPKKVRRDSLQIKKLFESLFYRGKCSRK